MARDEAKEEQAAVEAENGTALPSDVVRLILLKATPLTLWSSRLVCKHWYSLLISPEFVGARRSATGGAWIVTLHHTRSDTGPYWGAVTGANIIVYNPLLNIQETVSVPIFFEARPDAKGCVSYQFHINGSGSKHRLSLRARLSEWNRISAAAATCSVTWNPVSGSVDRNFLPPLWYGTKAPPPQDVASPAWTRKIYAENFMIAYCVGGLKIFQRSVDGWEIIGAMPDDMWQLMRERRCCFVATPTYSLIWTGHTSREGEMVALFLPKKGSWTWVDNIWHHGSDMCQSNVFHSVVLQCF